MYKNNIDESLIRLEGKIYKKINDVIFGMIKDKDYNADVCGKNIFDYTNYNVKLIMENKNYSVMLYKFIFLNKLNIDLFFRWDANTEGYAFLFKKFFCYVAYYKDKDFIQIEIASFSNHNVINEVHFSFIKNIKECNIVIKICSDCLSEYDLLSFFRVHKILFGSKTLFIINSFNSISLRHFFNSDYCNGELLGLNKIIYIKDIKYKEFQDPVTSILINRYGDGEIKICGNYRKSIYINRCILYRSLKFYFIFYIKV